MASITSTAAMAAATTAIGATTGTTGLLTFTGTLPDGRPASTVVPAMGFFDIIDPPTGGRTRDISVGGHTYNLWSLTNNPFYGQLAHHNCAPGRCNIHLSYTQYLPGAAPTLFLIGFFAVAALFHLPFGLWRRTWGYAIGLFLGCGLEVAGYLGRYRQRTDPFSQDNFLLDLVCLTIGPAFCSAAIYLCLARIIVAYGTGNARFHPRFYTFTFMCGDIFALILQGAGGGVAATADSGTSTEQAGINTMIAGLAFQVVSLAFFMALATDFSVCVLRGRSDRNPDFADLVRSRKWKFYLFTLGLATVTIFIRCCYRVAELRAGFESDFANDEVTYSALESLMVGLAVLALTLGHPGFIFGKRWAEANFSLSGRAVPRHSPGTIDSLGEKRGSSRESPR